MSDHFDPYYTWLGIPPEEQPADHYRLLGVRRFESNSEVLVNAADQRMAYLRTFQAGKRAVHSQKLLNEVSAAQVCLLDPAKKRAYDERLSRESAAKDVAVQPAAVVPVALAQPVAQALPRAKPIQPLVTTPIAPATTYPRPEAPRPAPLFAQPLVTLSASAHPLQPMVKPKLALPASPVVLIAVASAAALVLLLMGGLIWASWPRAKPEIVQEGKSEEGTNQQPTIVAPPQRPDVRPPSPPVEKAQPPITLVDVPSSSPPASPAAGLPIVFSPDEARAIQKESADRLRKPVEETNSLGMKLRLIPPGKFRMGWTSQRLPEPAGQPPVVEKEIAEAFYLGACEVTIGQFRRFVTDSGYKTDAERNGRGVGVWDADLRRDVFKPEYTWQNLPYPTADDHPVGGVSWNDAQAFCRWLSSQELRNYMLPAEAQWEFACRAGSEGVWSFGDDPAEQEKYGWFFPTKGSRPVGSKLPNGFGLFDMHGSASEWCLDRMGSVAGKDNRVFRGGSINSNPAWTSSAYRHGHERDSAWNALGFRVALPASAVSPQPGTIAGTAKSAAALNTMVPLLDPASVRFAVRFETGSEAMWARFTPDGEQVSFGSLGDSTGGGYATDGSGSLRQLRIPTPVFALSADGSMLAKAQRYAQQSDMIQVDRISADGRSSPMSRNGTGARLRGEAKALAFSEDRRILFAACGATEKLLALSVFKNLEPIPAFRSNLADVAWLDVRGDTLVCLDANGAVEVHSIRGRRILQTLQVPAFPNSPAVLLEPAPQKLSLLVFAPGQAVVQQLTGSRTLDRFPVFGLTSTEKLLAVSSDGDLVVLRDRPGIVIWSIAQNRAPTQIDLSHTLRFCAIHSQPPLLAFEAPDDQLFLCDLAKLLTRPHWQLPNGAGWNAAYPASRGSITVSKSDSPPRPADEPPRNRFPGPMQPPVEDKAGLAAIEALRAKGVQGLPAENVKHLQLTGIDLTAAEIDGLKLLKALEVLDLSGCPCAPLVLERLRGSPNLRSIRLHESPVGDKDMDALATLASLRDVDLSSTQVTGAGLAKLKVLKELRQIALPGGTAADLMAAIGELTALEQVNVLPSGITDADLAHVGRLTNLRELPLYQASLQGEGLAHLKNLNQLGRLGLPDTLPVTAWQFLKDVQFESLYCPGSLGDHELTYLLGNRRLKELTPSAQITDAGLRMLATCPALENLSLFTCSQLTDDGLAVLSQFPALKELRVPAGFEPKSMRHVVAIRGLVKLNLTACNHEVPLAPLVAHPRLAALELGKDVGDDDCAVLARMPAVADIQFHGSQLTAKGILHLRSMSRLERLSFFHVPLTETEANAIGALQQLKHLTLIHHGLTPERLEALRKSLSLNSFGSTKE